jgi:hypothetical protein
MLGSARAKARSTEPGRLCTTSHPLLVGAVIVGSLLTKRPRSPLVLASPVRRLLSLSRDALLAHKSGIHVFIKTPSDMTDQLD